jgi:hypothetical protein
VILAALALLASQPQTIVAVDPKHRLIEGVATDGSKIWLSSLIDRQILLCKASCSVIATLPEGLHPFAISWDVRAKRLWVAADCPPGVPFITACERGALIGLDARGRIRARIAPAAGPFHPGDVSSAGGQVFVSDSQNGAVYRLASGGTSLLTLVAPGVGKSGQGTVLSADGKQLIAADYSQGIASINLATGARDLLPRQDGKPLRGIDGLARCGDTYLGIYNGASPGRLVTIEARPGGIDYGELIPDLKLPDPTQLAFDGKRLLVVADAGWELAIKGTPRTKGATILAIPLDKDCKPL